MALRITDWTIYPPDENHHVMLEIHTDAGISGWGAAFSQKHQVIGALGWLKRFVMNENPLETERVTEKLHQITFWLGRGGAMTHAISAINIALWDIAGKHYGQPIAVLLGGQQQKRVPVYGSILFHPLADLVQRIQKMRERHFHAIKLGWDPFGQQSLADDTKLIQTAREAAGDDCTLLIDAGGSRPFWRGRYKDALERARMLADFGVYWYEEALAPDDLEGYARLTDASPVKIAHGEVLTRRQTFVPFFKARAMDIVQPDVAKVGGLSEMRRILWLAEEYGIDLVPHGWNTAVGVAADIQLTATQHTKTFVEFNVGNPLVEELINPTFVLGEDGCLPVPDAPGLGIELDRGRLRALEASGFKCESWTWDEDRDYESLSGGGA